MDLEGKNKCGLTIDCNYDKEYVNISIPAYIPNPSNVFYTLTQKIHDMHPTNGQCQNMAKSLSIQKDQKTPHILMKKVTKTYNPRSVH